MFDLRPHLHVVIVRSGAVETGVVFRYDGDVGVFSQDGAQVQRKSRECLVHAKPPRVGRLSCDSAQQ